MGKLGRLLRMAQSSGRGRRRPMGRRPVGRTRPRAGGGLGMILRRLLR